MSSKLGAVKYGTGDSRAVPGPRLRPPARLLRGHRRGHRHRGARPDRGARTTRRGRSWFSTATRSTQMVLELVEKETLNKEDLERILAPVRKRPPHNTFSGFGKRTPSDRPPVDIPLRARSNGRSDPTKDQAPPGHSPHPGTGSRTTANPASRTVNRRMASTRRAMASRATASRGRATGTRARATAVSRRRVTVSPGRVTGFRPALATASRHIRRYWRRARKPVSARQPIPAAWRHSPRAAPRPGRWHCGLRVTLRQGSRPEGVDLARAEAAVRELLFAIGEDPDREGLKTHPGRGLRGPTRRSSPACTSIRTTCSRRRSTRTTTSSSWSRTSRCTRRASTISCRGTGRRPSATSRARTVGITGLSKLARLVDLYARRPQVQERLTSQVADAVAQRPGTAGVIVVIQAEHLCMAMRGIRKPGALTVTSAVRGIFQSDPRTRAEALSLILGPMATVSGPCPPGRIAWSSWASSTSRRTRSPTAAATSIVDDAVAHGCRCAPREPTSSTSAVSRPARARSGCGRGRGADGSSLSLRRWSPTACRVGIDTYRAVGRRACAGRRRRRGQRRVRRARRPGHGRGRPSGRVSVDPHALARRTAPRCRSWPTTTTSSTMSAGSWPSGSTPRLHAGVDADRIVIDPGLGFAKTAAHNWALLARSTSWLASGLPVLVGASRKSFLGRVLADPAGTSRPVDEREAATIALTAYAAAQGAWGVRVHDVRANVDAARTIAAVREAATR